MQSQCGGALMKKLDDSEIRGVLERDLPQWSLDDGHLTRTYETGGWQRTMLLASGIGFLAESAFHHPDLLLQYPGLTVRLRTHDADGITARDTTLAKRIEDLVTWAPEADSPLDGPPGDWIR